MRKLHELPSGVRWIYYLNKEELLEFCVYHKILHDQNITVAELRGIVKEFILDWRLMVELGVQIDDLSILSKEPPIADLIQLNEEVSLSPPVLDGPFDEPPIQQRNIPSARSTETIYHSFVENNQIIERETSNHILL